MDPFSATYALSLVPIQTILNLAKPDGNLFPRRHWFGGDARRPDMLVELNSRRQFDQSDVVVLLAAFILRMRRYGCDINNLCTRPVIMNINDSHFDDDGLSALTVVLTVCR